MQQGPFISTVRVNTPTSGPHEYVSVWIRGQNVGTLCVGKGDGERLALLLRGCRCTDGFLDQHGVHMLGCPVAGPGDRVVLCGAEGWHEEPTITEAKP